MEFSDEELIWKYRKGDEAALEALVKKYLPLIYGFARQYTGDGDNAADIAQETFVKAWKNLSKFEAKKSFKPWLFTIAKNTALDWLKRKKETPFSAFERPEGEGNTLLDIAADPALSAPALLGQKMAAQDIAGRLMHLPVNYRVAVSLRHKEGLTFREISARIGKPLHTVKSHYRRALIALRKEITQ